MECTCELLLTILTRFRNDEFPISDLIQENFLKFFHFINGAKVVYKAQGNCASTSYQLPSSYLIRELYELLQMVARTDTKVEWIED